MDKIKLPNVTLISVDCINLERTQKALTISQLGIEFGAVKFLTSFPADDPNAINIPHIGSVEDYNTFCINELYKYVDTDYVLMVEYDGFILNADSWTDEFLKYDYIGAPISRKASWDESIPWVVGNSGFCLRSKRFLELSAKLSAEKKIIKHFPEDVAVCVWYKDEFVKEGMTYAPAELAMKFSVQEDYGAYHKPFGFHGFYGKNMDELKDKYPNFPFYNFMPKVRTKRAEKVAWVFKDVAVEGHLQGSMAKGNTDPYSDIDVWLTFKDEDFAEAKEKRLEYYAQIGEILHICESPQNAPIGGIFSSVIYKTKVGLLVVDYSLCPLSTSYKTEDYKYFFGDIELPAGKFEYNPEKVQVGEDYRIDFFISTINGSIKKLVRDVPNALEHLFVEYGYLSERYGLETEPLTNSENNYEALKEVIAKTEKISNEKQKITLSEILAVINQIEVN
jgi:predicted nucleotidyltransferase